MLVFNTEPKKLIFNATPTSAQPVDAFSSLRPDTGTVANSTPSVTVQPGATMLQDAAAAIVRAPFRATQSLTTTVNKAVGAPVLPQFNQNNASAKVFLGNDPVQTIPEAIKTTQQGLQGAGIPSAIAGPFGAFTALGSLALDFSPLGGEENAFKTLAAMKDVTQIERFGRQIGIAEDLLKNFAEAGVKADTPEAAKNLLQYYSDLQKTTKAAPDLVRNVDNIVDNSPRAIVQPTRVETQAAARDVAPTVQTADIPQATQGITHSPTGILPTQEVKTVSSPEVYKAVSEAVKEPINTVKRVTNSIQKTFTNLTEYVQNAEERVRQLVNRKDLKVTDASDPYLRMTLYSGRVGTKVEQGYERASQLFTDMKMAANEYGTDLSTIENDVHDYLVANHAPERNAVLGDGAAGITTDAAKLRLKDISSQAHGDAVAEIAQKVLSLHKQTLTMLKESGVISEDLFNTLNKTYKNHVPLQRIMDDTEDVGGVLSARGFDVKSSGLRRAEGSQREVDNVFTNILSNYQQAAIRSEKNIADQATLAFVRNNKQQLAGLMEEVKPKVVGTASDGRPILERTQDPKILQLFENGRPVWIKVSDPKLAVALRGVGREKLPALLNAVGTFTRFYAGLATRFNPEFALPNKIRDLQETAVYLASQNKMGFKGAAKTALRDPASMKDVMDALRGADTPGARLYQELKDMGGTTGGFGLSTKKQVELDLNSIRQLANSRTKRIANNLVEYIDNWNTIFEDSTRLSVYKTALDQGLSKDRAAFLAKEASINFNRMGKGGPVINALWMFSNASIQGSTKMLRSLANPKVAAATGLAVAGSVGAVSEWNDRVDPNWRDKVTKWDRLNGLPVVLPSANGDTFHYFVIPTSWGLKPLMVMANYAYDAVSGAKFDPQQMVHDTLTAVVNAYNPLGGTDWISALVPSLLDTPVEIARNQSWSGAKIRPDAMHGEPADTLYFDSLRQTTTGKTAISITELLQQKANILISPADLAYAFNQYIGGAGNSVRKVANSITGATQGKLPPLDEYPMISRFYRERTGEEIGAGAGGTLDQLNNLNADQARQKKQLKNLAEDTWTELKDLPKEELKAQLREIAKENPDLVKKIIDVATDEKQGLNYSDRQLKSATVEARAQFIFSQKATFKTDAEWKSYLKDLAAKKILTESVIERMVELKAGQPKAEDKQSLLDKGKGALAAVQGFMGNLGPKTVGEARKQGLMIIGNPNALKGLPDDAPIPEGVRFFDPTGAVGAIEKVGAKAAGKIASSVLQVVNHSTGETKFFRIAASELERFKTLVDDGVKGMAGIPDKAGNVFHITAKTPQQMLERGFTDGGMANLDMLPTKVTSHARADGTIPVKEYVKSTGTASSKQSTVGNTSTSKGLTGKGGVSGLKTGTSGGFEVTNLSTQQQGMRDTALRIAKQRGIETTPDGNLVLYHGTKEGRAPTEGDTWRIGSYFTDNPNTAASFASAGQGGRVKVMKVEVPPHVVFNSGDGSYWNSNEPFIVKSYISKRSTKTGTSGGFDGGKDYRGVDIRTFADDKKNFEILPPSSLKKPTKLWRGEQSGIGLGTGSGAEGLGLYTTTNKRIAKSYADLHKNGVLKEMPLNSAPNNPLYFRGPSEVQSWIMKVAKSLGMRVSEFNEKIGINKIVTDLGYDGVAFDHGSDNGVAFVKFDTPPSTKTGTSGGFGGGQTLYHATPIGNAEKIAKEGLRPSERGAMGAGYYFTPDKQASADYVKSMKGSTSDFVSVRLKPSARIYNYDPQKAYLDQDALGKAIKDLPNKSAMRELLLKEGYDGVKMGKSLAIYNKSAFETI